MSPTQYGFPLMPASLIINTIQLLMDEQLHTLRKPQLEKHKDYETF